MKPADGRHLLDDQMIAVYIGAEPRFGRRNRALSHLQTCRVCVRRYQELVGQLAELREDGAAEVDAIFTPDRLEAQRLQILARLENAAHPARVIPFPSHGSQNLSVFTSTQMRRWIGAAAAACLIIGFTLGRITDFGSMPRDNSAHASVPAAPARTVQSPVELPPPAPAASEEEILSRAEQVQGLGPMEVPASLEALSAMTPIRDVALRLPQGR